MARAWKPTEHQRNALEYIARYPMCTTTDVFGHGTRERKPLMNTLKRLVARGLLARQLPPPVFGQFESRWMVVDEAWQAAQDALTAVKPRGPRVKKIAPRRARARFHEDTTG